LQLQATSTIDSLPVVLFLPAPLYSPLPPRRSKEAIIDGEKQKTAKIKAEIENLPPEVKNIPVDPEYPFPKLDPEKIDPEGYARWLMYQAKLPLSTTTRIAYRPNMRGEEGILGSAEDNGRVTFWKDMEKIPAVAQWGVALHELGHRVSPLRVENTPLYGSAEKRERAELNAYRMAEQAIITRRFLNGYHKYRYKQMMTGQIPYELWVEETQQIALNLAGENPAHLQQVEDAQRRRMDRMGRRNDFVALTSQQNRDGTWNVSALDQALMDLTKIQSVEELHNHYRKVREKLPKKTPLHTGDIAQPLDYPMPVSGPAPIEQEPIINNEEWGKIWKWIAMQTIMMIYFMQLLEQDQSPFTEVIYLRRGRYTGFSLQA